MSVFNDTLNIVYNKKPLEELLQEYLTHPIKIKNIVITKEFDSKDIVLKYYPDINFRYIEHIDSFYTKYIKYKNKYFKLKQNSGLTYIIENKNKIQKHFSSFEFCSIEDISIYNIFHLNDMEGITTGYSGGVLYCGMIEDIETVFKFFNMKEITDSNSNEIGITNYISDYILNNNNKKLTDNITGFYYSIRCVDYLIQDYPFIEELRMKLPKHNYNDIQMMIVEKVNGDLKGFLKNYLPNKNKLITNNEKKNIIKMFDSIIFQVIYILYLLDYHMDGFIHGDLHLGNILIKPTKNINTTFHITRKIYYDDEEPDSIVSKIKLNTFGIIPKLWDFSTSYVGSINKNLTDKTFTDKYFSYLGNIKPIKFNNKPLNKDIKFFLESIMLLSSIYYIPSEYISELINNFEGKSITRIFSIFLSTIESKYTDNNIDQQSSDFIIQF